MTTVIYEMSLYSTDLPLQPINQHGNFSTNLIENGTENQQNYILIFLCVLSLIGFLLNVRVIWRMIDIAKRKTEERHVNIIVCHLCVITLIPIGLMIYYYLQYFNVVEYGPSCYVLSFCRSFATGAIPLLNCNIFYERTKPIGSPRDTSPFPERVIWIYIVTILISIPSYSLVQFSVNSETGISSCTRIPLAGSFQLTVMYMLARFTVFYVIPIVYMSAVIWKIRYTAQMQNIFNRNPSRGRNTSSKLPLCYIFIDFFIFIGSWIPIGFLYLLTAILGRQENSTWQGKPFVIAVMGLISLSYCILFPLMYLRGIEKVPLADIFCCRLNYFRINQRAPENAVSMRNLQEMILDEHIELSPLDALLSPSIVYYDVVHGTVH